MELWFFLVWNSHPKRVKQPIANPIKRLFYKSNGIQVARIRAEAKGRDERKHTLDARIYPVVRIATAHLHPRCWSTHEEYRFPAIKSLPWTQSRSPWSRFPLRSFTKNVGASTSPAQSCRRRSTPSRRVFDVADEPTRLQGVGAPSSSFGSLKNQLTRHNTLLSHSIKS